MCNFVEMKNLNVACIFLLKPYVSTKTLYITVRLFNLLDESMLKWICFFIFEMDVKYSIKTINEIYSCLLNDFGKLSYFSFKVFVVTIFHYLNFVLLYEYLLKWNRLCSRLQECLYLTTLLKYRVVWICVEMNVKYG